MTRTFFGIYRGKVENNVDPMTRGRVQVSVPAVLGDGRLAWAEPCLPYAGDQVGTYAVPPVGASAWVQFEGGDPDYPVLAGCFWGDGENPAQGLPQVKVFATDSITVTASDVPGAGGLTIELASGAKLVLDATKIELSTGTGGRITLEGPKVTINDGALEII